MSRRLSRKERIRKRVSNKAKQADRIEKLDAKGVSRKQHKFILSPSLFILLKISLVVLIPIIYFIYSPLLLVLFVLYVAMFWMAKATEKYLNRSVIKSNHIIIPKYDSGISFILVIIGLFGSIYQVASQSGRGFGRFANTWWTTATRTLEQVGALMTGTRSIFGNLRFLFGIAGRPEGFRPPSGNFGAEFGGMSGGGGRPPFTPELTDLPIEFMFSNLLSTVITVSIFTVAALGILSIVQTVIKIKRFEKGMNEYTPETRLEILDDETIEHILDFGVIETEA